MKNKRSGCTTTTLRDFSKRFSVQNTLRNSAIFRKIWYFREIFAQFSSDSFFNFFELRRLFRRDWFASRGRFNHVRLINDSGHSARYINNWTSRNSTQLRRAPGSKHRGAEARRRRWAILQRGHRPRCIFHHNFIYNIVLGYKDHKSWETCCVLFPIKWEVMPKPK